MKSLDLGEPVFGSGFLTGPFAQSLLAIALGLGCSSCVHQQSELLRERCAQLANRGYSDRAELVALLRAHGQGVSGDERALRDAAKQFCVAHL